MLTLAASDSTARAPMLYAVLTAGTEIDRCIEAARASTPDTPGLYAALLMGKVYVTGHELVLGEHGPYVDLQPSTDDRGRVLEVYTSRRHLPADVDPVDAHAMPFAAVVRALKEGVAVALNPGAKPTLRLDASEVELLRRVLLRG